MGFPGQSLQIQRLPKLEVLPQHLAQVCCAGVDFCSIIVHRVQRLQMRKFAYEKFASFNKNITGGIKNIRFLFLSLLPLFLDRHVLL